MFNSSRHLSLPLNAAVVSTFKVAAFAGLALSLAACGGRVSAERDAERERAASQGGGYCDFISNIDHPDIEVEVGLRLSKRCDMNKSFSITEYRTEKNNNGILFCCAGQNKRAANSSNGSSTGAGTGGGSTTITTTTPAPKPATPPASDKKAAPGSELDFDK